MDDAKLEALKNRRMKGFDIQISVKPTKSDELAPGAPEKEEPEGMEPEMKEEMGMEKAVMPQMNDEEMMSDMLDETGFKKRFGKKVG